MLTRGSNRVLWFGAVAAVLACASATWIVRRYRDRTPLVPIRDGSNNGTIEQETVNFLLSEPSPVPAWQRANHAGKQRLFATRPGLLSNSEAADIAANNNKLRLETTPSGGLFLVGSIDPRNFDLLYDALAVRTIRCHGVFFAPSKSVLQGIARHAAALSNYLGGGDVRWITETSHLVDDQDDALVAKTWERDLERFRRRFAIHRVVAEPSGSRSRLSPNQLGMEVGIHVPRPGRASDPIHILERLRVKYDWKFPLVRQGIVYARVTVPFIILNRGSWVMTLTYFYDRDHDEWAFGHVRWTPDVPNQFVPRTFDRRSVSTFVKSTSELGGRADDLSVSSLSFDVPVVINDNAEESR